MVLLIALAKIGKGRIKRQLAGVHVNMAERLSLFRKSVLIIFCRMLGVPVVLHLHAAQLHQFYAQLPMTLQRVTRWVFSLPASVMVLGSASRRFVTEDLLVAADRVEIVINGVPEPTEPRRNITQGEIQHVLFLGNLSERKGVTDLLQALRQPGFDVAKLKVTLAGGGDVAFYQGKAKELGVSNLVFFEGWADQQKVARLMARSDILVLPSYDEGLPLVVLEALANGVAIVCSAVGEIPSVLTDGVNACFVVPGDIHGIAAALQKLLYQPAVRQALEHNGRVIYEQKFSLAQFFASIASVHQRHFGIAAQPIQAGRLVQEPAP